MTLVTSGTVLRSTTDQEAITRKDATFKRSERRKRAKARAEAASGRMNQRCSPSQCEGLHQEKQLQRSVRRANRRSRHRLVIGCREVEQGLLNLVNQQGGTRQDPQRTRVGLHSLLATATLYGTHTQLTKTVAKVQSNSKSEQTTGSGIGGGEAVGCCGFSKSTHCSLNTAVTGGWDPVDRACTAVWAQGACLGGFRGNTLLHVPWSTAGSGNKLYSIQYILGTGRWYPDPICW